MSFKLKFQPGGSPAIASLSVPVNTTILKDQVLALDVANDGVIPATSSSTTLTLFAVAQDAITASASVVQKVRAILLQRGQIWEGLCTNNTAANQQLNRHVLSSGVAVNNTSSDITDNTGHVTMIRTNGAAADKKAEFIFNQAVPVT